MRSLRLAICLSLLLTAGCGDVFAEHVAFGDSVTFGWGGKRGGWVSILEDETGSPIANYGLPTERVVDGKGRFVGPLGPLALEPWSSDILLMEGGNDLASVFLRRPCDRKCRPDDVAPQIQEIVDDVAWIVDEARAHGKNVTIGTYWRVNAQACSSGPLVLRTPEEVISANAFIDTFDAGLVEMAYERRVPVVRLDELHLEDDAANFHDCMHPSDEGYRRVAEAWRPALE